MICLRVGVTLPREVPEEGQPAANPGFGWEGTLVSGFEVSPLCLWGKREVLKAWVSPCLLWALESCRGSVTKSRMFTCEDCVCIGRGAIICAQNLPGFANHYQHLVLTKLVSYEC